MTDSPDLIKLYSTRILALAAAIPLQGRLETPQATVRRRSPLCGSTVTVDLDITEGRISRFAQEVRACALGQAAAAVLGQAVIGRTPAELSKALAQLTGMLTAGGPVPESPFGGYDVLLPAREFRNRHPSILLALGAAEEAARQATILA